MDNKNLSSEALLSNNGDMTSFRYGNSNIRFRTPKCLYLKFMAHVPLFKSRSLF